MGSSKFRHRNNKQRQAIRRLQFDSLEDRRLLAGLNVFVFDDANASQAWETSGEQGTANRVVFLDANRNGRIDSGERWAKTNEQGLATFDKLNVGSYFPTLLDGNRSVVQTTQTSPATFGSLTATGLSTRIVEWTSEAQAWTIQNGQLVKFDFNLGSSVQTLSGLGNVLDAAVLAGQNRAVVLTDLGQSTRQVSLVDLVSGSVTKVNGAVKGIVTQVQRTADTFVLTSQSGNFSYLYRVDTGLSSSPIIASIQNVPSLTNASVKTSPDSDLIFVQQTRTSGNVLTALKLNRTDVTVAHQRFVSGVVSDFAVERSGSLLAVAFAAGGVRTYDVAQGFRQVANFTSTSGPIAFDSVRGQLIAGSSANSSTLSAWNTKTWKRAYTFNAGIDGATPVSMTGRSISTNPFSTRVVATSNSGTYVHDIAVVKPTAARVTTSSSTVRVEIGQRLVGNNQAPTMQSMSLVGLEDTSIAISSELLKKFSSDANSDDIHYFVAQGPQNGVIDWSPSNGGIYLPNANYFGADSLVLQAFDGRDWASPQTISIDIEPVNDVPSGITIPPMEISERTLAGQEIGMITVVDPDPGAIYEITVDDPRIFVVGGMLKVAQDAIFDYESESSVVLEITGRDVGESKDIVTKTITIDVRDENDAPTGIVIDSTEVAENEKGATIGSLKVIDPDAVDQYAWQISDGRFIVEDGKLKLAANQTLNFETQSTVDVMLTAVDKGMERVSEKFTIQVEDRNDPAIAIHMEKTAVVERVRGYRLGWVSVQDEDVGEVYQFSVNDSRFEIVEGVLRLKPGKFVSFSSEQQIPIEITAKSMSNPTQIKRAVMLKVIENAAPWQNASLPVDVDGDGVITPRDPLKIINELNRRGIQTLGDAPDHTEGPGGDDWIDVNGDGVLSPLDAILVINHLNRNGVGSGGGGGTGEGIGGGEGEGPDPAPSNPVTKNKNQGLPNSGTEKSGGKKWSTPERSKTSIIGDRTYDQSLDVYLSELAREQSSRRRRMR